MNYSSVIPMILVLCAATSCNRTSFTTQVEKAPRAAGFCDPIQADISPYQIQDYDLKYWEDGQFQALTTAYEGQEVILQVDTKYILEKAREIGMSNTDYEMYIDAIIIHEACVHAQESSIEHSISPIDIPSNFSGIGKQIIGVKGSYILVKGGSTEPYPLIGFKEMIAMYFMYNNDRVSKEFVQKYGPLLPQWELYQLAEALVTANEVDFNKALHYFNSDILDNNMRGWEEILGHPFYELNDKGVPKILTKAWTLELTPSTAGKTNEEVVKYYHSNFSQIEPSATP